MQFGLCGLAFDVVSQLLQPFKTIETQEAPCLKMGAAAKTSFAAISAKPPPQRRGDYRQLIGQINCVRLKAVLPSIVSGCVIPTITP